MLCDHVAFQLTKVSTRHAHSPPKHIQPLPSTQAAPSPSHYQTPRPDLDLTLPPRPFLPPLSTKLAATQYTPSATLGPAFNVGLTSAGVGLFISAIKNSLESHNKGAMGVFTRTGWIVGYFGQSTV